MSKTYIDEKLIKLGFERRWFSDAGLFTCEYSVQANQTFKWPRVVWVCDMGNVIRVQVQAHENSGYHEPIGLSFDEMSAIYEMFFGTPKCDYDVIERSFCEVYQYGRDHIFYMFFEK